MTKNRKEKKVHNRLNRPKIFQIIDPTRIGMDGARLGAAPIALYFRTKVSMVHPENRKNVRWLKGGAVIVSNHVGYLDPLLVFTVFWFRRLYFLAGEAVMDKQPQGVLLKYAGCIRIDRNISDIESINYAVDRLKQGYLLTMFPQGKIIRSGELDSIKEGVVLIASMGDVPIIPMYSEKRSKWWHRRKVVMGDPIYWKDYCKKPYPSMKDIDNISQVVLSKMIECRDVHWERFGKPSDGGME